MEKVYGKLQILQEILLEKYAIERDILEIPKALETKQEILNRLKKSYIEKNAEYDKVTVEVKHLTFEMGEAERHREDSEKKMDIITTQREYEALDKEISDASVKEQHFRREIQKKELEIQELRETLERDELMIKMQEEELSADKEQIRAQIDTKKNQLSALSKKEEEITPGMDESILFKFQRIIKNKSGVGIVPIKSNVCSGCHMMLPAQFVNDVRSGDKIQFCSYCSRILYWESGGEPTADSYEFDEQNVGGLADIIEDLGDEL